MLVRVGTALIAVLAFLLLRLRQEARGATCHATCGGFGGLLERSSYRWAALSLCFAPLWRRFEMVKWILVCHVLIRGICTAIEMRKVFGKALPRVGVFGSYGFVDPVTCF